MLTWNKTNAFILAAVGILVSSTVPQLTLGQSPSPANAAQQDNGEFVQDSLPFSRPFQQPGGSTEPLQKQIGNSDSLLAQPVTLPATIESMNSETRSTSEFAVNQQVTQSNGSVAPSSSTPLKSNSDLPTVIVRPPANGSMKISDINVDVENIAGSNNTEFAVRLMVPDSVKVIEFTPIQNPDSKRNFKIQLEQQPIDHSGKQRASAITSSYSMPVASPVYSASSLNSVQPSMESKMPMEESALPRMIPANQQLPVRGKFKRNPFFQPVGTNKTQPLATNSRMSGPPTVLEAGMPSQMAPIDQTQAKQASYSTTSSPSILPREVDGSASRTTYVDSAESESAIHSAIFGPNKMGLGDSGDFVISVFNPTNVMINDVIVRLDVPSGFEVVVLDRAAKLGENAGSLIWRIPDVAADQEHLIRYRVKSLIEGAQLQQVRVGTGKNDVRSSQLNTVVDVEFANPEAPFLPFESN